MQHIQKLIKDLDQPVKWLFYGDSITHGARHTNGWRDYTEIFTERIRYELARIQDIVIKTAISGNTTVDLLNDYDWRLKQFSPDVVFLMIGMNDCSTGREVPLDLFKRNLRELADRIEVDGAKLVLQTTCLILPGTSPDREPNYAAYMDAIRELADERDLPLVDHARYWQDNIDRLYYWQSDPFHPNEVGHRAFAYELFRALGIFDPEALTCQQFLA